MVDDIDWSPLTGLFTEPDYFGFTTTQKYADEQVPWPPLLSCDVARRHFKVVVTSI